MKKLFLAILILLGAAAHVRASNLYATCTGDGVDIVAYSESKEYGSYVVTVGKDSTFHQEAWESSLKEIRRFSVNRMNYVSIDSETKTGTVAIQGLTTPLKCTIAANASTTRNHENCRRLPAWFSIEDDDGSLCPLGHVIGQSRGADVYFMCCKWPPI